MTDNKERRGWSYAGAVDAGLEPRLYDWKTVPEGPWAGTLDFRYWADNGGPGTLVCCFTSTDGGKYRLSAFRQKDGRYTPKDNVIDFGESGIDGTRYTVRTGKNRNGNLAWLEATTDTGTPTSLPPVVVPGTADGGA
jgi:hypothetical protein